MKWLYHNLISSKDYWNDQLEQGKKLEYQKKLLYLWANQFKFEKEDGSVDDWVIEKIIDYKTTPRTWEDL